MSRQGRFGKYGDTQRPDRLRDSRTRTEPAGAASDQTRSAAFQSWRISIRRATPADAAFIGRLSGNVFSVYGPYRRLVPEWFESGLTLTLVAVEEGAPVGFAMVGRFSEEHARENRCELLAIAVEPRLHRRGIGEMMLRKIEKEIESLGERVLSLHTAMDNVPAQRLFKKARFTPLSIKRRFYPAGQDALMMTKPI